MSTGSQQRSPSGSGRDKGYRGLGMEGLVARWYAKNTGGNLDEFRVLAKTLYAQVPRGGNVLEIAPGPGYLAIELARRGDCHVTGLDISHSFVEIAKRNARAAGVDVDFRQGNAAAMPLGDEGFDFVVCRAAFKNFSQPVEALDEMARVLKSGGQALIIDMSKDASQADINVAVQSMKLGAVNSAMTKLIFKHMLLKRAYRSQDFDRMARASRFGSCQIRSHGISLEVRLTKPTA
jgi:ubiquinone/menaquinone biosynthesis C-methylase UbiE